jgi:uncharacterized protein (TIGR04255 family)
MSAYFSMIPDVPGREARAIKGFMQRTVIQEPEIEGESAITLASQQSADKDCVRILLDIDVNKRMETTAGVSEADIWNTLDCCRKIKNRIFFSSVTDKTIEKYK